MILANKKDKDFIVSDADIYIGRGSLLGNPYTHIPKGTKADYIVVSREEACLEYEAWLWNKVLVERDRKIINFLAKIDENARLICYCVPKQCHGETVIRVSKWVKKHVKIKETKEL